jgi:hypothetical protein
MVVLVSAWIVVDVYDEVSTDVVEEGARMFIKEIAKNPIAMTASKRMN